MVNQLVNKILNNDDRREATSLTNLVDSLCVPYATQFRKLSVMLDLASTVNILRESRDLPVMSVDEIVRKVEQSEDRTSLVQSINEMILDRSHKLYNVFTA
jgi:hypothetical protein